MRLAIVILLCGAATANAQKTKTIQKNLFGLLPHSEYLQDQLKLTKQQKQRLSEIYYQTVKPSRMLFMPAASRQLKLSNAQKNKIREIKTQSLKKMTEISRDRQGKTAIERLKLMKAAEAQSNVDVLKVLTRSQMKKMERLRGKPIDPGKILKVRPNV